MTTPSDQEMLEINTFKSLIHRAIQFEYASWCKERDKKRAREISLESGNEDKDASELLRSKPQNNPEIFLYGYDGPGNRGTDGT